MSDESETEANPGVEGLLADEVSSPAAKARHDPALKPDTIQHTLALDVATPARLTSKWFYFWLSQTHQYHHAAFGVKADCADRTVPTGTVAVLGQWPEYKNGGRGKGKRKNAWCGGWCMKPDRLEYRPSIRNRY